MNKYVIITFDQPDCEFINRLLHQSQLIGPLHDYFLILFAVGGPFCYAIHALEGVEWSRLLVLNTEFCLFLF